MDVYYEPDWTGRIVTRIFGLLRFLLSCHSRCTRYDRIVVWRIHNHDTTFLFLNSQFKADDAQQVTTSQ